jgi:hypothetical protein
MNCLKDYIGILSYGSQEPLSGLFLNQLPGITMEVLDKISDKDQVNFTGVWKDVQMRAWLRLEKDFRAALRNRYRLSAVKASARLDAVATETIIAAAAKYRGLVVDLEGMRNQSAFSSIPRTQGAFLNVYIDKISVVLTEDCALLVVKIFDRHGIELDSFTRTAAEAGTVVIQVSKRYPVRQVFIAIDAELVPLYTATIDSATEASSCEALQAICMHAAPTLFPVETSKSTPAVHIKTTHYFGMSLTYGALCDYSSVICSNKEEFMDVWLYLLGVEMLVERMYSTRLNRYTTIDLKAAGELKDYLTVEYEKRLAETIAGLDISNEDSCIECSPMVTQREVLP